MCTADFREVGMMYEVRVAALKGQLHMLPGVGSVAVSLMAERCEVSVLTDTVLGGWFLGVCGG